MKILWQSQHPPLSVQREWLTRRFGEVEFVQDSRSFKSEEEIKTRFETGGFDDIVVVAPLSVIDHLCRIGIKPMWAEMLEVKHDDQHDLEYRGRFYCFITMRRIMAVKFEFEEV